MFESLVSLLESDRSSSKWNLINSLLNILNSGADYQTQLGVKGRLKRSVKWSRRQPLLGCIPPYLDMLTGQ